MSGVRFFMFLIALPALAALGHDLYLFYLNQYQGFDLTAAGFLWTNYHPESYAWVKENAGPQAWELLNFLLQQKALFLGIGLVLLVYFVLGILQFFRLWPFNATEGKAFSKGRRLDEILSRGDKKKRRKKF